MVGGLFGVLFVGGVSEVRLGAGGEPSVYRPLEFGFFDVIYFHVTIVDVFLDVIVSNSLLFFDFL